MLYSLIGKQSLYPEEYRMKGSYARLLCGLTCKCCNCCLPQDDTLFEERKLMLADCITCIDEKMDIKNYLHDSMDFMAIKQLLMKSRHKILMPSLILNITKNKTKLHSGYKTSFVRNMCERIDKPVFTLEEAVEQLHDTTEERPQTEKDMDQLFLHNLPRAIMDMGMSKDTLKLPINQRRTVNRKEGFQKKTKTNSLQDFDRLKTKTNITINEMIAPKDHKIGDAQISRVKPRSNINLLPYNSDDQYKSPKIEQNLKPRKRFNNIWNSSNIKSFAGGSTRSINKLDSPVMKSNKEMAPKLRTSLFAVSKITPINVRRASRTNNTLAPETLTQHMAPDNFQRLVATQVESTKRQLRKISGNSNHCPDQNLPGQARDEFPQPEQEKSSESSGLEKIGGFGSSNEEDDERESPGGVEADESKIFHGGQV